MSIKDHNPGFQEDRCHCGLLIPLRVDLMYETGRDMRENIIETPVLPEKQGTIGRLLNME